MHHKFKLFLYCIAVAISLNSCVLTAVLIGTAAIAGGTVYYINGNYIIEIPRDLRTVYNASIKTIQMDSKYRLLNHTYSDKTAIVTATKAGVSTSIKLSNIDSRSTEVKIRIGTLGDEKSSVDLANQITKNIA